MEHHVQSVEDSLIGGLSYKLKNGASYVTDRRSVTFFASGGNQYSSAGVKVMRFNLASDAWMDPSTFRIQFQLNNKSFVADGINFVLPLSWNPAVFFRRCRITAGGQVIEDIDDFQPHQVNKKKAVYARHEGMRKKDIPTIPMQIKKASESAQNRAT